MPDESSLTDLAKRYERNLLLRTLVQLIPCIGGATDTLVLAKLQNIRTERLREFFDKLGSDGIHLTPELIESEDFLHCYFATVNAVMRTRRREKIRYLAQLLTSTIFDQGIEDVDQYEEFLALVDDLSFRELNLVALLVKHERSNPMGEDENELARAKRIWPAFVVEASEKLKISEELIQPMLTRLQRSGCYAEITGSFFDYTGGLGTTTALYQKLEQIAGDISD